MRVPRLNMLAVCLLFAACASRITPSGGPRDSTSPEVTKVFPENGSTGFQGNQLSLEFSEYVQLKDGGTGILISPPQVSHPQVSLKGKSVLIRFRENLAANTTYSIIIGKSVVDLTEGNPLKEFQFVFSTGPSIDTLSLKGSVEDAFSTKPAPNALVMLYPFLNDSLPVKTLPLKLARTDSAGSFKISNIGRGKYMVFALKDENNNYRYDLPEEKTGFIDTLFGIEAELNKPVNFRISENPEQRQRLLKYTFSPPGRIMLKYAQPVSSWRVILPDGSSKAEWTSGFVSGTDSLIAWLPRFRGDTIRFYSQTVADGLERNDTVAIRTRSGTVGKAGRVAVQDTTLKFTTNLNGGKLLPEDTLRILAGRPISAVNPARIRLFSEKDTLAFDFPARTSPDKLSYKLTGLPGGERKSNIICFPGAFTDIYGVSNDTLRWDFREFTADELGALSMGIKDTLPAGNWLWQLTNKEGRLITQAKYVPGVPLTVPVVLPGIYALRVFRDENNNRSWDHGNFYKKIQPEQILHYPSEINVRAGWDLELTWELKK